MSENAPEPLTGEALLQKAKELLDLPREERAKLCGYYRITKDNQTHANIKDFYDAIIAAYNPEKRILNQLRIQNFKSWKDTGLMRMASLTGLFGTNSSGKTAIIQFLLILKQTVESTDRQQVLHTGDHQTYVDIGTFYDAIHRHIIPGKIDFKINWTLPKVLLVYNLKEEDPILFSVPVLSLSFAASIEGTEESVIAKEFNYLFDYKDKTYEFGMQATKNKSEYKLVSEGYSFKKIKSINPNELLQPVKNYGFPEQVNAYYKNAGFLSRFALELENLFQNIYYLGPLRDYPRRSYAWGGQKPQDVGKKGELAIPALLASRGEKISGGKDRPSQTIEERVAEWLRDLGLIHEFALKPIAKNRKDYEVLVRRSPGSSEVLITDVGFGVSQILPVLVLCYYVPEGSIIILEQPEIHLHPSVQAGLADVFIDVIKTRKVQIILESHSEHLLRRLQRRIAEEKLDHNDAALYFCQTDENGDSQLLPLELDSFGNINNWPDGFFGDEMGELVAMTEAAMSRRLDQPI